MTDTMSWTRRSTGQELAPKRDGAVPLLEVSELRTHFATDDGEFRAVDGGKYPPAKPGALMSEPLKAAWRGL